MKTRNQILMALTIVSTLFAGGLLMWHTPPDELAVGETRLPAPEPTAAPEYSAAATDAKPGLVAPGAILSIPGSIRNTCKSGYSIERDSEGRFEGFSCNPSAYEDYSTEALESLAYGDADAASTLAHRLRHSDYPRALRLALRSVALSGGDVTTLVSATLWRPLQDENGEPSAAGFAQAYVLHSLIKKIRNSTTNVPVRFELNIRRLSDDPDTVLDQLDVVVERLLDDVRQIELEVTGNSTIGGDDDV